MHCVFSGLCFDCMCVIVCANDVNYIRGRMYIRNVNSRVEKRKLKSSGNERMVWDIKSIIWSACVLIV